jgi:hypothetical protein
MKCIRGYLIVIAVLAVVGFTGGCGVVPPPIDVPMEVVAETVGSIDQNSSVVSSVITNTGMDWKTLLLFTLLAGWAIPSPSQMLGWLAGPLSVLKWW